MKIIFILSNSRLTDGSTKAFLNLAKYLSKNKVQMLAVCPDKNGIYQLIKESNDPNIRVINLDYTYSILPFTRSLGDYFMWIPRYLKRTIKNRMAAKQLTDIAKEFKPDIIHTNTSVNNIGYIAAGKLEIPHIWHIREYGDKDFNVINPGLEKFLRSSDNYSICITEDIRKYKGLSNNDNSTVIYDGVLDENKIIYPEDDKGYFLFAGSVSILKGIGDLISAYENYCRKVGISNALPLKVAGAIHPTAQDLVKRIQNSQVSSKIEFLGRLDDITALLAGAKAVIIPSHSEGFGFVMPEALAAGAIIIARDSGGLKEQFDNGLKLKQEEIGLRFNTVDELEKLLIEVSSNPKTNYMEMISRGQECVRNLYTIDSHGSRVLNFYKNVILRK